MRAILISSTWQQKMSDKAQETQTQNDPLSDLTRREKRNLLAVSLFIITAKVFDIHLKEAELNGHKISFDEGAVPFILVVSGLYFLITFIQYWIIDYKNYTPPAHYRMLKAQFHDTTKNWKRDHLLNEITQIVNKYNKINIMQERALGSYVANIIILNLVKTIKLDIDYQSNSITELLFNKYLVGTETDRIEAKTLISRTLFAYKIASTSKTSLNYTIFLTFKSLYIFRNYIWDFAVPVVLAIFAGFVMAGMDVSWLKELTNQFFPAQQAAKC